ncbi:MAG: HD domain-containing phosphohydrolase [Sinimarinibacterium sp.]|jgi:putative two-component system response regulator
MSLQDKPVVLIVDDTPQNLEVASRILREHYKALIALDGATALQLAAAERQPELILLDVMMPGMSGYDVCRRLKQNERTRRIPVIFLTALTETSNEEAAFAAGAVDFIPKPFQPATLLARVRTHVLLGVQERHLSALVESRTQELQARTRELEQTRLEVIRRLGRAAEYKDDDTGLHVIRMSHYARLLAVAAGFSDDRADVLFNAAPMHDIGKIGIPDHILQKPGPLTEAEWVQMRRHPAIGAGILGRHRSELLETARVVALTHHERWDGTGYPRQRAAGDIPIEGRIVAVADVFDALTSKRPYKDEWPIDDAVKYLQDFCGRHFDPELVPRFVELLPEIRRIKLAYSEAAASQAA